MIPAQPVPRPEVFLRFSAATNTKKTIPAQPVPRPKRESYFRFSAAKTPTTRFPLNPSHDKKTGIVFLRFWLAKDTQKHDSRSTRPTRPRGGNRSFEVFLQRKHEKHDSSSTRPTTGEEGIVFLVFWAAKNTKNTIPAQPVPRPEVFLRFTAATNTKNTIPAQSVPRPKRRESYF